MVFYLLSISAELENLTNLQPRGGCDDPSYRYYFKVKCENCGEISQKETCVTMSETVPLSSGRATANLVQKCKLCGREGSIQMIPGQGQPLTLEQSQAEQFSALMVFDCRGFEPIGFSFGDGWKAESTSGTVFDVDLSEGEFADYDEKGECPVGISNLQEKFKVVKKNERHGKTSYSRCRRGSENRDPLGACILVKLVLKGFSMTSSALLAVKFYIVQIDISVC